MSTIVIYKTATDELLQTCKVKEKYQIIEDMVNIVFDIRKVSPADYSYRVYEKDNYTTNEFKHRCYIINGQIYEKGNIFYAVDKKIITADGSDKATFSGLVEGVEVRVDGTLIGTVDSDGIVEITSTIPKELTVYFSLEHYLPSEEKITAEAV